MVLILFLNYIDSELFKFKGSNIKHVCLNIVHQAKIIQKQDLLEIPNITDIQTVWKKLFQENKQSVNWNEARKQFRVKFELSPLALRGFKKFSVVNSQLLQDKLFKVFTKFPKFYEKPCYSVERIYNSLPSLDWIGCLLGHHAFLGLQDYSTELKNGEFFARLSTHYVVAFEFKKENEVNKLGAILSDKKLSIFYDKRLTSKNESGLFLQELIESQEILKDLKPATSFIFLDQGEEKLFNHLKTQMQTEEDVLNAFFEYVENRGIETVEEFIEFNKRYEFVSKKARSRLRHSKTYQKDQLKAMSVHQLKEILGSLGISSSTFFEKSDMINGILDAQ